VPEVENRLLHEAGVELADAGRHEAEQALRHRPVGEDEFPEDGGGHHAGFAPGERRDVGRALDAVHGGQFAEQLPGLQFVENDFLARGRAHEDPDLAGQEEVDVRRELVEIDQDFLRTEATPIGPRLEGSKIDIQPFKQQNPGKPRHFRPQSRECRP
jgi:hypothetical protein